MIRLLLCSQFAMPVPSTCSLFVQQLEYSLSFAFCTLCPTGGDERLEP